ncbi:polyketide synthase dehydratase domain-containing protein, partial [Burkholderia sp. Ac-20379]|uniref:polyketide synthase dehydratase domain-containing protein n=1 Tax=Burkholderia sp. Ac-20379 TaxID=2703900 RepID=UPI00197E9EFF
AGQLALDEDAGAAPRHRYTMRLDGRAFFLRDHQVQGRGVLPGMAHLEFVREAHARATGCGPGAELTQHTWLRPAVQASSAALPLTLTLERIAEGSYAYEIADGAGDGAQVFGTGRIAALRADAPRAPVHDLPKLRALTPDTLDVDACYRRFAALGLAYGPAHRTLQALHAGDGLVLARLEWSAELEADARQDGWPGG